MFWLDLQKVNIILTWYLLYNVIQAIWLEELLIRV